MVKKTLYKNEPGHEQTLVSVKKAAYDLFQHALLQGHLRPGQLVTQRELIDLLALSIGALRELLPRLEAEGLLTVMPQRGIQITVIDLPMIRDAFQMRIALEREAVITATSELPKEVVDQQRRLHADIIERLSTDPSTDLLDEGQGIDTDFHNLLVGCTGNDLLIQAYNVNSIRIRLIKLDRIRLSATTLPSAFGDHLAVLDAIGARNTTKAVEAMEAHIHNARARAISF